MFRGRYIRLFLLWVDKPLTHYQIVDLEDIASLLMYRIKTVSKRRYVAMPYSSHLVVLRVGFSQLLFLWWCLFLHNLLMLFPLTPSYNPALRNCNTIF